MSQLYLYGLTAAAKLPARLAANGVSLVADGARAAIVSELGDGPVDATRRNLLAHADVVEELHASAVVLPARFGTVLPDADAAVALLRLDEVDELFRRHRDTCELTLTGTYDEAVLADAAAETADLRTAYRTAPTVERGIALGEAVGDALARRRARDATIVLDRLAPLVEEVVAGDAPGELGAFRLALLTRRDAVERVSEALEELAERLSPPLRFALVGPLPPYSFVDLHLPVAA